MGSTGVSGLSWSDGLGYLASSCQLGIDAADGPSGQFRNGFLRRCGVCSLSFPARCHREAGLVLLLFGGSSVRRFWVKRLQLRPLPLSEPGGCLLAQHLRSAHSVVESLQVVVWDGGGDGGGLLLLLRVIPVGVEFLPHPLDSLLLSLPLFPSGSTDEQSISDVAGALRKGVVHETSDLVFIHLEASLPLLPLGLMFLDPGQFRSLASYAVDWICVSQDLDDDGSVHIIHGLVQDLGRNWISHLSRLDSQTG